MIYCPDCDIVYDTKYCPLCEAKDTIQELKNQIEKLEIELKEAKK